MSYPMHGKPQIVMICLDMDPKSKQGDQHTGAAHLYVLETLQMLAQRAIPTLAITRWDSPDRPESELIGDTVRLVRIPIGPIESKPKEYLWGQEATSLALIRSVIRKYQFHPVLIHSVYWYSGVIGKEIANDYSCPFIYTVISLGKAKHLTQGSVNAHDLAREKAEQDLFEKATVIVSVCQQEKSNILRLYSDIPPERVVVIGRGINPTLFSPQPDHSDTYLQEHIIQTHGDKKEYLLFAGRLIESKGYSFFLQVYSELLLDQTLTTPLLWLIGGTPVEIEEAIKKSFVNERLQEAHKQGLIRWWGIVPRNVMPAFYRQACLTCLPSIYDPGARVILESMACETPIVMTPTGYAEEAVETGFNGYVADYGDISSWATYIKALLRDPVWRRILGIRARASVLPYFSLERFAERHWQVYQLALGFLPPPLSFDNSGPINARTLFPEWQTPPDCLREPALPSRIDDIKIWAQRVGYQVDTSIEDLSGPGNSSAIYRFKSGMEEYYIKQFLPKRLFYRVFYPAQNEVSYRSAQTRWVAEMCFRDDPLFLPLLGVDQEHFLTLSRRAHIVGVDEWNIPRVRELFNRVSEFHLRQRTKWSRLLSHPLPIPCRDGKLEAFLQYDFALQSLNSEFQAGERWHTPAQLSVELRRIELSIKNHVWDLEPKIEEAIKIGLVYMGQHNLPLSPLTIGWGECRPGHVAIGPDNILYGLDAETCSISEPERDFGTFFWWYLDLRTSAYVAERANLMKSFFQSWEESASVKVMVLGWMWLLTFEFLLWDLSRGRLGRYHRFIEFLRNFPTFADAALS